MNLAGFNGRKVRNVGDQLTHPVGMFVQLLYEAFAIARVVEPANFKRLGISKNCSKRRAQFV